MVSDEDFTEAIRAYPVLYDKNSPGYKNKTMVNNAWKDVLEQIGEKRTDENVAAAKTRFFNIKKRFNNRRRKEVGPSGSGSQDTQEGREQFQDMAYLRWMVPHIQLRKTKTNLVKSKIQPVSARKLIRQFAEEEIRREQNQRTSREEEGMENEEYEDEDTNDGSSQVSVEEDEEMYREEDLGENINHIPELTDDGSIAEREEPAKTKPPPKKKSSAISQTTRREKWHQSKKDIDKIQIDLLNTAKDVLKTSTSENVPKDDKENSTNVTFGKHIAAELDELPPKFQRRARHEIHNILFKIQTEADDASIYESAVHAGHPQPSHRQFQFLQQGNLQPNNHLPQLQQQNYHQQHQARQSRQQQQQQQQQQPQFYDMDSSQFQNSSKSRVNDSPLSENFDLLTSPRNESGPAQTGALINSSMMTSPEYPPAQG